MTGIGNEASPVPDRFTLFGLPDASLEIAVTRSGLRVMSVKT
jgi:hypothetical protein